MAYQQQYVIGQQMGVQQQQHVVQHPQHAALQAAQLEIGHPAGHAAGPTTAAAAIPIRRPFDPTAHELDANFRLTRFADLKGRGCKVPQEVLLKLLEGLQEDGNNAENEHSHFMHMAIPKIGKKVI